MDDFMSEDVFIASVPPDSCYVFVIASFNPTISVVPIAKTTGILEYSG